VIKQRQAATHRVFGTWTGWSDSAHTARHTYWALLAKMKVDPLTMRDLLSHGNLVSTMTYVHLEAEATERTMLDGFTKLSGGIKGVCVVRVRAQKWALQAAIC